MPKASTPRTLSACAADLGKAQALVLSVLKKAPQTHGALCKALQAVPMIRGAKVLLDMRRQGLIDVYEVRGVRTYMVPGVRV